MKKRLEITVFGTMYHVGAVHLTPDAIRAGVSAYGQDEWRKHLCAVALGEASKKLSGEVMRVLGQPVVFSYRVQGILMQGRSFGLEIFHGGEHLPVSAVDAESNTLQPSELMRSYKMGDMLTVFWARRPGAMSFRWDDVDNVSQDDVCLAYDSLTPLLAGKRPFDLVVDILWQGKKGQRKEPGAASKLSAHQHVFHKAN